MSFKGKICLGFGLVLVGIIIIFTGNPLTSPVLSLIVPVIVIVAGGFLVNVGLNERNQTTMPMYTTETIPDKKIVKSLGTVEARSNPFTGPGVAQSSAKKGLEKEALSLGANAIVGFKTQREEQQGGKDITYYMYGTAVVVEDEKK